MEEEKIKVEKKLTLESKVLHHDLLTRVEDLLVEENLIIDISNQLNDEILSNCDQPLDSIRASIGEIPYMRAEGLAAIEDYERIQKIAAKFNDILEPVKYSLLQGLMQTPEYQAAVERIGSLRLQANDPRNKTNKKTLLNQVKQLESQLKQQVQEFLASQSESTIPQWILDAIDLYIDTFMKGRINIRIYPFNSFPYFQVIANLKRDCLLDSDLENLLFAYGTQTNLKLTVIGLITSIPPRDNTIFNPMNEFNYEVGNQMEQARVWEKAFRGLFVGFQEIEKFMRFVSYPSVVIYPIAVYRTINGLKNTEFNLKNGRNSAKTRKGRRADN